MDKEDVVLIHTMEYESVMKKDEMLLFTATWTDRKGIILTVLRQRKINAVCYQLYVGSKKNNQFLLVSCWGRDVREGGQ